MAVLASDSFNRANAATLGTTDSFNGGTGYAWTSATTYGIISNQAQKQTGSASSSSAAWINPGVSDFTVFVTFATLGNNSRLTFRGTNDSNCWFVKANGTTNYQIIKRSGSVNTVLGTIAVVPTAGDVVKATCNGTSITVTINGANSTNVTDAFNQTATQVGILTDDTVARLDNFQVDDLSAGGTNATITAIAATATSSALAPTVTAQKNATITSVIASSVADGIAPTVSAQKQVSITSVAANSTATALAPSVGTPAIISAIVGSAAAAGIVPIVNAIRNIEIIGSIASALAVAGVPRIRKTGWSQIAAPSTTWRESTSTPTIWR